MSLVKNRRPNMSVRFGEKKTGLVIEKALIILRNETELLSHYSTERNGTERNGTNTFFAGENITACNSNP